MKIRQEGFGRRGVSKQAPQTRLEHASKKPFTHEDILAHVTGTALHNDLARPELQELVTQFKNLADRRSDGDSKNNALIFGGIIKEINYRLKRTEN
jgi:hypothetical protein